jgi:hypothetical protein
MKCVCIAHGTIHTYIQMHMYIMTSISCKEKTKEEKKKRKTKRATTLSLSVQEETEKKKSCLMRGPKTQLRENKQSLMIQMTFGGTSNKWPHTQVRCGREGQGRARQQRQQHPLPLSTPHRHDTCTPKHHLLWLPCKRSPGGVASSQRRGVNAGVHVCSGCGGFTLAFFFSSLTAKGGEK